MHKRAIYPGTFDPITYGHIDVIKRTSLIFEELIVAVSERNEKNPLFSLEERTLLVQKATKSFKNVRVIPFRNLLVDFAKQADAKIIIRGLRAVSDFEFEFQMALMNKEISPKIETLFIMSDPSYSFVSSKMIKEIAYLKGNLLRFVPDFVAAAVEEKIQQEK
jgi:pantetheine-phosphate adenylyltransferase